MSVEDVLFTSCWLNCDARSYQLSHTWDQVISGSRARSHCKQCVCVCLWLSNTIVLNYRHQNDELLFLWCPASASNIVFTCIMSRLANKSMMMVMMMMMVVYVCLCVCVCVCGNRKPYVVHSREIWRRCHVSGRLVRAWSYLEPDTGTSDGDYVEAAPVPCNSRRTPSDSLLPAVCTTSDASSGVVRIDPLGHKPRPKSAYHNVYFIVYLSCHSSVSLSILVVAFFPVLLKLEMGIKPKAPNVISWPNRTVRLLEPNQNFVARVRFPWQRIIPKSELWHITS